MNISRLALKVMANSPPIIDSGKFNVLGIRVNAINYRAVVEQIIAAAKSRQPLALSALAVHGIMTGVLDAEQGYRLNQLDLVVPDGQPVRWALNWLYQTQLPDRVYGPTLMLQVCEQAAQVGLPIYLYGSRMSVLEALEANLKQRFPGLTIAGAQPSRFAQITEQAQAAIAQDIRASGAAIVFVGLGCPRQEVWVYENSRLISLPCLAVGAAFDFHAGRMSQAPSWMQRRGLEWLYRLLHEPGRLWKRYVFLNPAYLTLLGLQGLGIWQGRKTSVPPPPPLRYG
ncbi:MAG: WecB/TagA/CpsF family glycosyltransferase [Leptolyngbyaceae cyanobacterium]